MTRITAIVVSHNPDITRLTLVLDSIIGQVFRVVVVDNGSRNVGEIEGLCRGVRGCDLIRLSFNSGIAYALMRGVRYAVNHFNPDWLLFLDDDTIVLNDTVKRALSIYEGLPKPVRDRVGLIKLGSWGNDCRVYEVLYEAFSGTLIRSDIAMKTCCRTNFFLDQADHDLYAKVREQGYLTLSINCKLVEHELGTKIWSPILSKIHGKDFIHYEPPWRYYYMVRNSTILFRERRMHSRIYLRQLLHWGLRIIFHDGFKRFLKPFGLGIMHALLNQEGYIDKKYFS
ncbi:glycosyltransferase [Vulcanisaeta distributa]|uniref:glycosyltransferase n=1 Tax=Vulcanisaeta distributa TaxID=164451 RepID=UPI000A76689C|nr:glycosyltransferase [Vulcanisaeta distributa]